MEAYRQGAFPMADPDTDEVSFYQAPTRGIFPIAPDDPAGAFHTPRSLRRRLNSRWFDIRSDTALAEVMLRCAAPRPDDDQSWINHTIIEWFSLLRQRGIAHSVEAWRPDPSGAEDHLVGGIYGLSIGGAFIGESMFSRPAPRTPDGGRHPLDGTDASKACLVRLVEHLTKQGYVLFDTQLVNPHLERFGCVEIPHSDYMRRLSHAADLPVTWGQFSTVA